MLLFYIRHGDPTYDPDALTPLGRRQAEAMGKRLALFGVDRIFASTSTRAIQTAQPTAELTKKEIQLLDFCNEMHAWRDFAIPGEDGSYTWAFAQDAMTQRFVSREIVSLGDRWYEHPDFAGYRFKEGVERVDRETDAFLQSLGYAHDRARRLYRAESPTEERVALFAHQGFGMSFLSSVLDIPYPQFCTHFDMTHSGMTVIEFRTAANGWVLPKVLMLSGDGHLYREGLPAYYNNTIRF